MRNLLLVTAFTLPLDLAASAQVSDKFNAASQARPKSVPHYLRRPKVRRSLASSA